MTTTERSQPTPTPRDPKCEITCELAFTEFESCVDRCWLHACRSGVLDAEQRRDRRTP